MITTTARDLITSTMRLIGVLAASETPAAAELSDGLTVLNGLIDEWGVHRLTMQAVARYPFDLVVGQQSYTIGEAGDFDIEPPITLDHVNLLLPTDTSNPQTELPLALLTYDLYAATAIKELTSSLPTQCFYNKTTAEIATLWLWPIPQQTGLQVILYVPTVVSQFDNVTVEVTLPPGYYKALRYNLAIELMAEYTLPPRDDIRQLAMDSLSAVKRINLVMADLTVDEAIQPVNAGLYNVLTDEGA